MEKDKFVFIEEKKLEKELKKKNSFSQKNVASDPIKAHLVKFRLDKKQIKPDDLI